MNEYDFAQKTIGLHGHGHHDGRYTIMAERRHRETSKWKIGHIKLEGDNARYLDKGDDKEVWAKLEAWVDRFQQAFDVEWADKRRAELDAL